MAVITAEIIDRDTDATIFEFEHDGYDIEVDHDGYGTISLYRGDEFVGSFNFLGDYEAHFAIEDAAIALLDSRA